MQEDAREVAKATNVDFGDDAVGAIMKKYDTNGDGVFQVNEYAAPPRRRKRPLRYPPPLWPLSARRVSRTLACVSSGVRGRRPTS